jgi:hypothetical protein
MDLAWTTISPSVDFTNASTTLLADEPSNWPPSFSVSGFVYDRFEQPQGAGTSTQRIWDQAARCDWLRHQAIYDAGPYEQATRVFRQHGYTSEAEKILIAQRREASRSASGRQTFVRRLLNRFYDLSVGYGYRSARVVWLISALLLLVTASSKFRRVSATLRAATANGIVYTTGGPLPTNRTPTGRPTVAVADSCGSGQIRCFNSVLYAVDTVIPLISLEQRSVWYPDPNAADGSFMQWWLNIATMLGWLLSSVFVLSLARLARTA